MAGDSAVPIVQQHVLDALGRWAERATGIREVHAEQDATKAARPYVSIEWLEEPGPEAGGVDRELAALPASATITLTAAEEDWSAVGVNLAHPGLQRELGEDLTDFADRWAALLGPFVAGRVTVTRDGEADVVLVAVAPGDLWRVDAIEGADVVMGDDVPARVRERVYSGSARVWVIGAARTSGKAGDAGDGHGVMELVSLLADALTREWCRELFDQFGIRCGTPDPQPVTQSGRRSNARRETRAYMDLKISVTARFGVAPDPVTAVGSTIGLQPTDPEIEPVEVQIELET